MHSPEIEEGDAEVLASKTSTQTNECVCLSGVSKLLSGGELARIFNRTTRTIRAWTRAGYLTPVRVGRSVFYRAEEIGALIAQGRPKG